MATYVRLRFNIDEIIKEIYEKTLEAEEARVREYQASMKIQAWFRGTRIRRYMQYLRTCATTVQRHWRGYLGRKLYRQVLIDSVDRMRVNYYNKMATKIQKVWRGYFTRKYIYDYYSRKQYLESIQEQNEIIRRELASYEENQRHESQKEQEQRHIEKQLKWAEKNHYLVSTYTQPGIYNSPFLRDPLPAEKLLRHTKAGKYTKRSPRPSKDEIETKIRSSHPVKLPPIPAYKPQGPFKDPSLVWVQRYRPLMSSLRVQTNYYSLEDAQEAMKNEEWAGRVHDDIFMPVHVRDHPYEPLLVTSSKYGHLDYGSKHFREEDLGQHVDGRFKNLVPRIHVFDRLNKDYMEGYVEQ